MDNFDKLKDDLITALSDIKYKGDISDIGNEIGIVTAKYFDSDNTREDFEHGINHGISLTDGTHP